MLNNFLIFHRKSLKFGGNIHCLDLKQCNRNFCKIIIKTKVIGKKPPRWQSRFVIFQQKLIVLNHVYEYQTQIGLGQDYLLSRFRTYFRLI